MYFTNKHKNAVTVALILLAIICFLGYHAFKEFKKNRNRLPQLIIDSDGIYITSQVLQVKWADLIDTYIKFDNSGENTSYHLLVYYLDEIEILTSIEINLQLYKVEYRELAYVIEYIKQQQSK